MFRFLLHPLLSLETFGLLDKRHPMNIQRTILEWPIEVFLLLHKKDDFLSLGRPPLKNVFKGIDPVRKASLFVTLQLMQRASSFLSDSCEDRKKIMGEGQMMKLDALRGGLTKFSELRTVASEWMPTIPGTSQLVEKPSPRLNWRTRRYGRGFQKA